MPQDLGACPGGIDVIMHVVPMVSATIFMTRGVRYITARTGDPAWARTAAAAVATKLRTRSIQHPNLLSRNRDPGHTGRPNIPALKVSEIPSGKPLRLLWKIAMEDSTS